MDQTSPAMQRIYLWANNRSLGTVFLKWFSNVENAQVINGIFTSSFFFGMDYGCSSDHHDYNLRTKTIEFEASEYPSVYDGSVVTYSWAKSQLECDYPGKQYLICKDLSFALGGNHDLIPRGFRHTFIIRHPYKVFPSWKKNFGQSFPTSDLREIIDNNYGKQYGFKEQYDILKYLQDHPDLGDSEPVIIDADDLLRNPASILSRYCQQVGIPYTDDMLQWNPGTDAVKNWKISQQLLGGGLHDTGKTGWYKTAMESSQFIPPKKLPERNELEEDVLECADISMKYYKMMYDMRIRP